MKNKMLFPVIFIAVFASIFAGPVLANDQCGNNIVIVDKKVGPDFTSFALRFRDQHTAEEFADQVNAAPIIKDKARQFVVRQRATVYAK